MASSAGAVQTPGDPELPGPVGSRLGKHEEAGLPHPLHAALSAHDSGRAVPRPEEGWLVTVSVTRVGACACTRACVSECIPTSLWAGHRAHCLQWGGDESCQPCSPREVLGPGWWVHVTDWAGRWVLMLGRGVGLAQAGGMLSLEPEAALSARAGGGVPLCQAAQGGPSRTLTLSPRGGGLVWAGLAPAPVVSCGSTGAGCSRVALLGPPALLRRVSHLPVRWPGSSSRRDRRLSTSRVTAHPRACTQGGESRGQHGDPSPAAGQVCTGPLCKADHQRSAHSTQWGTETW